MADEIVSTTRLEGADQVVSDFKKMGAAGAAATKDMASGAGPLNKQLADIATASKNAEAAGRKMGDSLRNVGSAVAGVGSNIRSAISTLTRYTAVIGGLMVVAKKLGGTQESTTEETKQSVAASKRQGSQFADSQVRAINLRKALDDLNRAYAAGSVTEEEFVKRRAEIIESARREEKAEREVALVRSAEEEERIRNTEAIKRQAAAQKAYSETVGTWGADMAGALTKFGGSWDRFINEWNQGPSVIGGVIRGIADFIDKNGTEIIKTFTKIGENFRKIFEDDGGKGVDAMEIFRGVATIINSVLIPAFKMLREMFKGIAEGINTIFGTKFSGDAILVAVILFKLVGGFRLLISIVGLAINIFKVLRIAIFAVTVAARANPVGAIITGIVLLIALLATLNWDKVKQSAIAAWTAIKNAWNGAVSFFSNLWNQIKNTASGVWDWISGKSAAAWQWVKDTWNGALEFFAGLWAQIKESAGGVWDWISEKAASAWQWVKDTWNGALEFFSGLWTQIKEAAGGVWDWISEKSAAAWQWIKDTWNGALEFFSGLWTQIKDKAKEAWDALSKAASDAMTAVIEWVTKAFEPIKEFIDWVKKAAKALLELIGLGGDKGAAATAKGMRRGGLIRGPGSGTSDSVPIWGSAGEWMMRARAVQYYGRGFMAAVNSLRFPRSPFDQLSDALVLATPRAGFAAGGEITRSSGGEGRPVILQFPDGRSFALSAASETADQLGRYAVSRRLSAAGRKPSYYGAV